MTVENLPGFFLQMEDRCHRMGYQYQLVGPHGPYPRLKKHCQPQD